MASIFESMMNSNRKLTEKSATSRRKFGCNHIKVESRKIFEENDIADLEKDFEIPDEEASTDTDEVVLVIDPEIKSDQDVPEDAAEEMVGDLVYKCPVCGSNYVCGCEDHISEEIEVDETGTPIECPICGDDAEQILVGEIAPAEEASGDETNLDPQEAPENDEEVEDDIVDDEAEYDEEGIPSDEDDLGEGLRSKKTVKSKREGKRRFARRAVKEEFEDECPDCVDDSPLDLDVTPAEEDDGADIVINNSEVEIVLDDEVFESMMTRMVRENYKGSPSFKITRASRRGSTLKIEYVVRNRKGSKKGILVGEGFDPKKKVLKVAFRDKGAFTESMKKSPIIKMEFVRRGCQVTPLRMSYDYKVRVKESVYRVSGKVSGSFKKNGLNESGDDGSRRRSSRRTPKSRRLKESLSSPDPSVSDETWSRAVESFVEEISPNFWDEDLKGSDSSDLRYFVDKDGIEWFATESDFYEDFEGEVDDPYEFFEEFIEKFSEDVYRSQKNFSLGQKLTKFFKNDFSKINDMNYKVEKEITDGLYAAIVYGGGGAPVVVCYDSTRVSDYLNALSSISEKMSKRRRRVKESTSTSSIKSKIVGIIRSLKLDHFVDNSGTLHIEAEYGRRRDKNIRDDVFRSVFGEGRYGRSPESYEWDIDGVEFGLELEHIGYEDYFIVDGLDFSDMGLNRERPSYDDYGPHR